MGGRGPHHPNEVGASLALLVPLTGLNPRRETSVVVEDFNHLLSGESKASYWKGCTKVGVKP